MYPFHLRVVILNREMVQADPVTQSAEMIIAYTLLIRLAGVLDYSHGQPGNYSTPPHFVIICHHVRSVTPHTHSRLNIPSGAILHWWPNTDVILLFRVAHPSVVLL